MVAVSLKKKIFFKQKTAYEIMSGDWSSDVCSSDLAVGGRRRSGRLEFGEDDGGERRTAPDRNERLAHARPSQHAGVGAEARGRPSGAPSAARLSRGDGDDG